jgi:hypothetical protein
MARDWKINRVILSFGQICHHRFTSIFISSRAKLLAGYHRIGHVRRSSLSTIITNASAADWIRLAHEVI